MSVNNPQDAKSTAMSEVPMHELKAGTTVANNVTRFAFSGLGHVISGPMPPLRDDADPCVMVLWDVYPSSVGERTLCDSFVLWLEYADELIVIS